MDAIELHGLDPDWASAHARRLVASYQHWTGSPLLDGAHTLDGPRLFQRLFVTEAVIVSHGTQEDPIFNFGNRAALELFEMPWDAFTRLPSRQSAEPMRREERQRLLERVGAHGYIDDYQGVRISATGRRFRIERATVWNLIDAEGALYGQAATFSAWTEVGRD